MKKDDHKLKEYEHKFKEHKLTPQRKAILQVFLENHGGHLSAEEILKYAQEKNNDIGFATVYRALDLFEKLKIINRVNFGDGRSRYELVQREMKHHHHHLVCMNCQRIIEVMDSLLHELEENIEEEHNFSIYDHRLEFYGYCEDCQEGED
ncbi:Fur family transcriptional regulator [Natranaerobius thermophilus]|uniref:Ferric uptake regulator, Fur family n=1 Tax=Natranaerobius thermophilus (strain ATCC BAA-1301 / DSM 18059 / JW/NM-WN-LF) TaxID=457570 RepID=B2A3I5_NATTJ|nr:transcriptional repressor [Natranaerobius thermophilus]ACB86414.1 ferric uptake regulator, Fur family [Natranaerobius thermophilus JW/NM-WN-LF]